MLVNTINKLAIALLLLLALSACCKPGNIGSLPVNLHAQERDWWCWAACTEMVSEYYLGSGKGIPQCESANFVHGTPPDCCTGCTGDCPCWGSGWGATIGEIQSNWTHWGFDYSYVSAPLPWTDDEGPDIKDTLSPKTYCGKSPIYVVWWWTGGGGHVVVAYGYAEIGADRYISYYNPLPVSCLEPAFEGDSCEETSGGDDVVILYDAFVDNGIHSWGDTFHRFKTQ